MNDQQLYEFLLNTLQPRYERAFGVERRKDLMNISSLVGGVRSYVWHWKERAYAPTGKLNLALLRGSSIHAYINQKLNDYDKHTLTWKVAYNWKDGSKDITILGHFDNVVKIDSEFALVEWKSTGQEDIYKNGLVLRAKRQIGAYAEILRLKTGISYECFIVVLNSDTHILKATPEEIVEGYRFVRATALDVAKVLDA